MGRFDGRFQNSADRLARQRVFGAQVAGSCREALGRVLRRIPLLHLARLAAAFRQVAAEIRALRRAAARALLVANANLPTFTTKTTRLQLPTGSTKYINRSQAFTVLLVHLIRLPQTKLVRLNHIRSRRRVNFRLHVAKLPPGGARFRRIRVAKHVRSVRRRCLQQHVPPYFLTRR